MRWPDALSGDGSEASAGSLGPEEEQRIRTEPLAQPFDGAEGEVALPALHTTDEGAVQVEGIGKALL